MADICSQKKILFVANVAKEHICKFHIPSIKKFKTQGWIVDVASKWDAEVPFVDHQYGMPWNRSPFSMGTIKGALMLRKIIKRERYDIIYCHTPVGGFVGRVAGVGLNVKIVYCAHGLHFYKGAPWVNWLVYYPVEKLLALITDAIITINDEDYKNVARRFRNGVKVFRIPGIGVDFSRLVLPPHLTSRTQLRNRYNIPDKAWVLIYVAELIQNKNQSMLIDSLKKLLQSDINAYLILLGPEHDNGYYKKYSRKMGVQERVIFTGWQTDIAQFMYMSDICVASSIREGFGINLIEAMFCHLPVVATDNRGHRSIISNGENGFLVPIGDSMQMAERVLEIIGNPGLFDRLSHIGVDEFQCDRVADTIYKLISSL